MNERDSINIPAGAILHAADVVNAGLDLLALGSALWIPSVTMWVAFALMAIGSDLRGRAEERLLELGFGETYRDYCRRTSRFVPGVY